MESFTEIKATSNADTIHFVADSMPPLRPSCPSDVGMVETCGIVDVFGKYTTTATTAIRARRNTKHPTIMPGRARFHGNGIGGGAAASRRTASMTATAKPDDGSISSSLERI